MFINMPDIILKRKKYGSIFEAIMTIVSPFSKIQQNYR